MTTKMTLPKPPNIAQLLAQVGFTEDNVLEAATINSVLFAEAVEFRFECLQNRANAKIAFERTAAQCELDLRKKARDADEKITESGVKATLQVNKDLEPLRKDLEAAEAREEYSKLVCDIFRMRRDCLQIVKDLVRNEISLQSAIEAGGEKLKEARKRLRERFPEK